MSWWLTLPQNFTIVELPKSNTKIGIIGLTTTDTVFTSSPGKSWAAAVLVTRALPCWQSRSAGQLSSPADAAADALLEGALPPFPACFSLPTRPQATT